MRRGNLTTFHDKFIQVDCSKSTDRIRQLQHSEVQMACQTNRRTNGMTLTKLS